MRRILLVAMLAIGALAATACEPTPTAKITAKTYDKYGAPESDFTCGYTVLIKGTVTPATATSKVVLQRTVGGKWVDERGWDDVDAAYAKQPSVRQAAVSPTSGAYTIRYFIDWVGTTKHLRVRSAGGGAVSASLYLNPQGWDGYCG